MTKAVGLHINKLEPNHFAHFPALNSAWHVLLNPETGQVAEIKARSPQTKVLARPYVRDQDYHARYLQSDPAQAGQWAAGVALAQRGRNPQADAWIVLNEPPCNSVEQVTRLALADVAYMKALDAQGAKGGIGAFSTGNLQIPRLDNGAQVRAYDPAFRYAAEHGHYLVIHCYAAARPMMGGATVSGWYHEPRYFGLRWHEEIFPYMRANGIPIPKVIISEFGLDLGFAKKYAGYTGQYVGYRVPLGWGYGDSEAGAKRYIDDLVPFATELAKDGEVEGICIYCAGDNGDDKWKSFMVDSVLGYLAGKEFPIATPTPPPAPVPVPPTPPTGGTLTDRLAAALRAEFGADFEDLRGKLPKHATLKYKAVDSRGFDYIAIHHSEGAKNGTWKNIATYHINPDYNRTPPKEAWAGIGYHGGVRQGKAALFDDVDTERAHVYGMNHESFGLCVTGNYDTGTLDERDLNALKRYIKVLDDVYGHQKQIKGHGEIRQGGYTACPGSDIKRILPTLREVAPIPPPPLAYTDEERAKAKWFTEQLARTLRGDPDATATLISALISEPKKAGLHNVLVEKAVPSLERVP